MDMLEVLVQVRELLQQQGRITYRLLKMQFQLDDEQLEVLKEELIDAEELAIDKDGKMLVWKEAGAAQEAENQRSAEATPRHTPSTADSQTDGRQDSRRTEAERRQLTVMFCDLVGSTTLSEQLDPEEYHEVVSRYQETCTAVIKRYAGHIAQHLGDGLLAYFGYPVAHEDDAQRAVRTGLEILAELSSLNARLPSAIKAQLPHPLQVRIGIHTGLVVIGEIGRSEKRELLALGETPNLAARLQGVAEPDTVVISGATQHLVQGLFEYQERGLQELKGLSTPVSVSRVVGESAAQSRFEVAVTTGLTPLIGREEELRVLQQRWAQAKEGAGQAVLLSGEAGIGKSRLMQEFKEQVSAAGATRMEFRCSPYHQNSAFYPIIDHLQRFLQFERQDAPHTKLAKLQHALQAYRFPQPDTFPLLAALLSLPHPEGLSPLTLSPQKQKEKTQEALVAWMMEEAEKRAVYCAWEDVHWVDPSTLDVLGLFLEQIPTVRIFSVLTCRPEFTPPWGAHSYLTQLTLNRLGRSQVETMVKNVTGGKSLPMEVMQQIINKTDGVPLFVEELTKNVVEQHVGAIHESPLQLGIPATLHDALMARLDRLNTAKEIAQLGATIGREFSYELLHTISPLDEDSLQQGLRQLVEVELLYQRGLPPQMTYLFKHALIQDTAYQSLLKSRRQQLHEQIARVLEARFPETKETQPELLAHHYTEAGLIEQAIPAWQQAGQNAVERSANVEAIAHLTKGLELLTSLPDTPEGIQQELLLQTTLGSALIATKGFGSPEVGKTYSRARELCRQVGETPQLFPVLWGLRVFYVVQAELRTARELTEQLMQLAQSVQDPLLRVMAHLGQGETLRILEKYVPAQAHLEQAIALYDPRNPRPPWDWHDPKVATLAYLAAILWILGYPDQSLRRIHKALSLAQELAHPFSLAWALRHASEMHYRRREGPATQEQAEKQMTFCTEQGFPFWVAHGAIYRGWALAEQGLAEEGIAQMRQGLAAFRALGAKIFMAPSHLLLAEGYRKAGQIEEGLRVVNENLGLWGGAEPYRLKGELLRQSSAKGPEACTREAEECFHQAINIARKQSAKSLELRAAMSLARLWQSQGKTTEARDLLAPVYDWFTEGFDTKDLQEAKMFIKELNQ